MKHLWIILAGLGSWVGLSAAEVETTADAGATTGKTVCILPVRDDIMPPILYTVRRGVKEAMEAKADVLILDMETNGGRLDTTEEILSALGKFRGLTVTYVNRKAFSAGAFIAVGTQRIYMSPQSVIGAATPVLMIPGGGIEKLPESFEAKMTSGVKALVRASARKNGYNTEVVEAMIDRSKELKIGDEVLNEKGQVLTLTNEEAEKEYGDPPKRLLSSGTAENLDELVNLLGYAGARRIAIKPTGAERVGTWINAISPLLMIIGIAGIYLEFKTPGFGIPGIVGITAFVLYFFGGYIAGVSDMVWIWIFLVGLGLVAVELFLTTGTILVGLAGVGIALLALVMATVDVYPGMPLWPTFEQLEKPLWDLMIAFLGSAVVLGLLSRWLPKTAYYARLVGPGVSGGETVALLDEAHRAQLGQIGESVSVLRPGGKARFGGEVLDVIADGGYIEKGRRVRIIKHSGAEAVVEEVSG